MACYCWPDRKPKPDRALVRNQLVSWSLRARRVPGRGRGCRCGDGRRHSRGCCCAVADHQPPAAPSIVAAWAVTAAAVDVASMSSAERRGLLAKLEGFMGDE